MSCEHCEGDLEPCAACRYQHTLYPTPGLPVLLTTVIQPLTGRLTISESPCTVTLTNRMAVTFGQDCVTMVGV